MFIICFCLPVGCGNAGQRAPLCQKPGIELLINCFEIGNVLLHIEIREFFVAVPDGLKNLSVLFIQFLRNCI